MGRRSINTTKSGKYMNPTDQARKEARKKELKKNKRQRQLVRTAVLKGKDPLQLINEMEKIDQMEFNVLQPSPLNEKVLKEKRKKLRDTLDRVMKMYIKDDPDKWEDLKRAEHDYEKRRGTLLAHYDSVKHAQQVTVDDIPLPQLGSAETLASLMVNVPSQIPLPPKVASVSDIRLPPSAPVMSILRKGSAYSPPHPFRARSPPGVPPGPPPDLSDDEIIEDTSAEDPTLKIDSKASRRRRKIRFAGNGDEGDVDNSSESDDEQNENEDDSNKLSTSLKPTSLQQRMLAVAGQDIDSFMKEIEEVHKNQNTSSDNSESQDLLMFPPAGLMPLGIPPAPPLGVPPPLIGGVIRLPAGPPPGRPMTLPPGPPPGLPSRLMNIRLPPGPPPGMPPRLIRFPSGIPLPPLAGPPPLFSLGASTATPNVLSAAPQLINRSSESTVVKSGPTIEAKAQIRNLSTDVTRFVPTALRVKKEDGIKSSAKPKAVEKSNISVFPSSESKFEKGVTNQPSSKNTQITKDDAYMQFMKEMQGLL